MVLLFVPGVVVLLFVAVLWCCASLALWCCCSSRCCGVVRRWRCGVAVRLGLVVLLFFPDVVLRLFAPRGLGAADRLGRSVG
ncbi:hypothetical protein [Actinoplanes subglobosus]|uniref:Secreted peptide n=1 Tax=Actinoplanes subglobosus TaxID=1547892 RepID=A0ABV8J5R7_9ACTN